MPTILITGGHSGIGLECVRQLAANQRFDILLAGRSPDRMEEIASYLRRSHKIRVRTLALDTSSLQSVRIAAAQCRSMLDNGEIDTLQAILCNAGGRSFGEIEYSPEGYEKIFASNYLGHFLLVHLLIEALPDNGRVVFTSSGTHDPDTADGKMVGPSVEPDAVALANAGKDGHEEISAGAMYATSKLCMILFAYELDRRLRNAGSGIASIAFDPGAVGGTSFLRGAPAILRLIASLPLVKWLMKRRGITMGSVELSGASLARLAFDPAFAEGSGKYFQVNDGSFGEAHSASISYDTERAEKLWTDTRRLIGLTEEEEWPQLR